MSATPLQPGFPIILGITGPGAGFGLNGGSVYIGEAGADPETTPLDIWWDAEQTIPALQPLDTIGGYITRAGTPSAVYAAADYSMRVRDRAGNLVFFSAFAGTAGDRFATNPYDFNYAASACGEVGQMSFILPIVRQTVYPGSFAGSRGFVEGNPPEASYVMNLSNSGGSPLGSVTISTGGVFTFATVGDADVTLNPGDVLMSIEAAPDATLTNFGFTLLGAH